MFNGKMPSLPDHVQREVHKMHAITGDMKVAEVIRRWPQTLDVFLSKGCSDARDGF
jgi:hypothetical protein